jgi:hypothetical protein
VCDEVHDLAQTGFRDKAETLSLRSSLDVAVSLLTRPTVDESALLAVLAGYLPVLVWAADERAITLPSQSILCPEHLCDALQSQSLKLPVALPLATALSTSLPFDAAAPCPSRSSLLKTLKLPARASAILCFLGSRVSRADLASWDAILRAAPASVALFVSSNCSAGCRYAERMWRGRPCWGFFFIFLLSCRYAIEKASKGWAKQRVFAPAGWPRSALLQAGGLCDLVLDSVTYPDTEAALLSSALGVPMIHGATPQPAAPSDCQPPVSVVRFRAKRAK